MSAFKYDGFLPSGIRCVLEFGDGATIEDVALARDLVSAWINIMNRMSKGTPYPEEKSEAVEKPAFLRKIMD